MADLGDPAIFSLDLKRKHYQAQAFLGYIGFSFDVLNVDKESFLHPEELNVYHALPYHKSQQRFLRGRYLAKRLLANQLQAEKLCSIWVRAGIFNQPLVNYPKRNPPAVSLSHSGRYSACLVFPQDHPMGVDIEEVKKENGKNISSQITPLERELLSQLDEPQNVFYTRLWTVKEALSKVLMTGLMTPMTVYQVDSIHQFDNYVVSTFSNFAQYKAVSFWWKDNICAIVLPRETYCYIPDEIFVYDGFELFP